MEETIGYEALFSSEEWDAIVSGDWSKLPPDDFPARNSSLSEENALQIARSLEDYTGVTVTDVGGSSEHGFWLDARDELTQTTHEINSWQDYWNFVVAFLRSLRAAKSGEGSALRAEETHSSCCSCRQGRSFRQEDRPQADSNLSSGVAEFGLGGAAVGVSSSNGPRCRSAASSDDKSATAKTKRQTSSAAPEERLSAAGSPAPAAAAG